MTPVEAFECLKEWALTYVKHRDMAARSRGGEAAAAHRLCRCWITGINGSDSGFVVANKDGTSVECIVKPSLKSFDLAAAAEKQNRPIIVFTLSNEENILAVYKAWEPLSENSSLIVVFANPSSATDDKWVLKPSIHNKVCDRNSLLQGLKAMSELVEPVSEEALAVLASESKR